MKYSIKLLTACFLLQLECFGQSTEKAFYIPDHVKLQYAGNIGFLSAGVGFENTKSRWEGDFFYGYLPESIGGVELHMVTSKIAWHAFKPKPLSKSLEVRPLSLGLLVNYTFGKQFFGFKPENYPYSYYKFPTSLHAGILAGSQLSWVLPKGDRLGLYAELNSFDTELISYFNNRKALKPIDVLSMGLGIKYSFP